MKECYRDLDDLVQEIIDLAANELLDWPDVKREIRDSINAYIKQKNVLTATNQNKPIIMTPT